MYIKKKKILLINIETMKIPTFSLCLHLNFTLSSNFKKLIYTFIIYRCLNIHVNIFLKNRTNSFHIVPFITHKINRSYKQMNLSHCRWRQLLVTNLQRSVKHPVRYDSLFTSRLSKCDRICDSRIAFRRASHGKQENKKKEILCRRTQDIHTLLRDVNQSAWTLSPLLLWEPRVISFFPSLSFLCFL